MEEQEYQKGREEWEGGREQQAWEDLAEFAKYHGWFVVCEKCGRYEQPDKAKAGGWLVAERKGEPKGRLIIRCPEHITDHARKQAGLRQEYYHQHRQDKAG